MKDSYDRVTIGEYERICSVLSSQGDPLDSQIEIVSILTGRTPAEIENSPYTEFARWSAALKFLETEPRKDRPARKAYRCGDLSLVPVCDARHITTAQYVDYQSFCATGEPSFAKKLSCFLVPEGCRYGEGYDTQEVQKAIADHLSVTDAMSLYAFFLKTYKRSISRSLFCSVLGIAALRMPLKERVRAAMVLLEKGRALARSGAGSAGWTPSARRAGAAGTMSGGCRPSSSSISSATRATRARRGSGSSRDGGGRTDG